MGVAIFGDETLRGVQSVGLSRRDVAPFFRTVSHLGWYRWAPNRILRRSGLVAEVVVVCDWVALKRRHHCSLGLANVNVIQGWFRLWVDITPALHQTDSDHWLFISAYHVSRVAADGAHSKRHVELGDVCRRGVVRSGCL